MQDITFQYPTGFLLLIILPLVLYLKGKCRQKLPYTLVSQERTISKPFFFKKEYDSILYILFFVCIVLGTVNLGYSKKTVKEFMESKWIIMALDVSGSMKRSANKLDDTSLEDIAVYGAKNFISMRGETDSLGIVVFSSKASLLAPLTFDKDLLNHKLEQLQEKSRLYREMSAGGGTNAPGAIWRSLTVFFSMLPRENRLNVMEISSLQNYMTGETDSLINIPRKLKDIGFGKGMSIILLTDGRIAPSKRVRSGEMPNFFNTLKLMDELEVKLYIISIGEEVDQAVVETLQESNIGRIFTTSKELDKKTIENVYREIDKLETNRILSRVTVTQKWTRNWFVIAAVIMFLALICLRIVPGYKKN